MLKAFVNWFTRSGSMGAHAGERAPAEAIFLRALGTVYLVLFIAATFTTKPSPGLSGKGLGVLLGMAALVVGVFATQPRRLGGAWAWQRVAALMLVTAASALLVALQPKGIWQAGPYFVGIMAAMRLERGVAVITLGVSLLVVCGVAVAANHGGQAVSVALGSVPWFLVIRLLRRNGEQQAALEASRAAQAEAAAVAERGRLAREMHDVLAHSLSALALQLESSRLLARDRDADPEVVKALDKAHHLAAGGLDEARRAIAAARGEELPGPDRLSSLTAAFAEQSGVPAELTIQGRRRELPPDVALAIYRTTQEALTNIRRHATPARVEVTLDFRDAETVLRVEDWGAPGTPPPPPAAAGGGYGLTGMRERAELLGGHLRAAPTATGFRVELILPADVAVAAGARR